MRSPVILSDALELGLVAYVGKKMLMSDIYRLEMVGNAFDDAEYAVAEGTLRSDRMSDLSDKELAVLAKDMIRRELYWIYPSRKFNLFVDVARHIEYGTVALRFHGDCLVDKW